MGKSIKKQIDKNAYKQWLVELKLRIRQSQLKAAVKVNIELLRLYWDLGQDIVVRQMDSVWGSGFFEQLSKELKREFPDMQGFSATNLKYCKRFYLFYSQENQIRQQAADEFENNPLFQVPWFHQVQIISHCKSIKEAYFYVNKTVENGWSRAVLMNFMEVGLYESQGKAINNFAKLLPDVQSDLAKETLKDPYNFDFLTLTDGYKERELEDDLIANVTQFLLELGQGFAFIGRQVPVTIGESDFFIDLLFYHLELKCYIVIELKTGKFEAEYIGKLGLYVSAINHQRKKETDNPTIGLLICKTKDNVVAKYSLEGSKHPIGISEYQLANLLPKNLKSALPSIQEIEEQLKG